MLKSPCTHVHLWRRPEMFSFSLTKNDFSQFTSAPCPLPFLGHFYLFKGKGPLLKVQYF